MRRYRYVGPAEVRRAALQGDEGYPIRSLAEFERWVATLDRRDLTEPFIEMCSPPGRASTGHRGLQMGYGALFQRRLAAAHRYSARVPIRSCAVPRSPVDHAGLASSMTPTDALCYR